MLQLLKLGKSIDSNLCTNRDGMDLPHDSSPLFLGPGFVSVSCTICIFTTTTKKLQIQEKKPILSLLISKNKEKAFCWVILSLV